MQLKQIIPGVGAVDPAANVPVSRLAHPTRDGPAGGLRALPGRSSRGRERRRSSTSRPGGASTRAVGGRLALAITGRGIEVVHRHGGWGR